jgi:intracellular septation protein
MSEQNKTTSGGASQLMVDLGPIAVFVIAFNLLQRFPETKENAVYWATGLFIIAVLAAIAYCLIKRGRIPPVLIVTGVLVTIFGGLTIAFHDENFIKIKVTVVNAFYALAILGSLAFKQNVWKLLFQHAFPPLPDSVWNTFAIRWGLFFVFMAGINEALRNSVTTETWVNLRLLPFGFTLLFALANTPLLMKHMPDEAASKQNPSS